AFASYGGTVAIEYAPYPVSFIEAGTGTYFAGSSLWLIDGGSVVETGFNEFPEIDAPYGSKVSTSAIGGSLGSGHSYSYRCYYEWYSATGERFLSATGADVVVALGGGNDTITTVWPTLRRTLKANVNLVLYRTLAEGTIFHRVASKPNDPTVDSVTFADGVAD